MTSRTDFQSLLKLKDFEPKERGWINSDEKKIIVEALELESRSPIELNNIRDFAVMFFGKLADAEQEDNMKKCMIYMDVMSAVTCVIDGYKMQYGME